MKNIIYALSNRFNFFIKYFFNKNYKRVPIDEMFFHLFSPTCEIIAKRFVENISSDSNYNYFKIKGFTEEFSYPKSIPYHHFAQVISEGMQKKHWHYYEIAETAVGPEDIVLDCGSAEGFFTFQNQNKCKKIYVIEPLPVFVESLNKLFLNKSNIEIMPFALGDQCGSLFIEPSNIGSVIKNTTDNNFNSIKIDCFTVDKLFFEKDLKVTYIKADLEGYEEKMILGALNTIKKWRPKIAITTYHRENDYKKILSIVKSVIPDINYKIKGYENIEGKPVMLHMW